MHRCGKRMGKPRKIVYKWLIFHLQEGITITKFIHSIVDSELLYNIVVLCWFCCAFIVFSSSFLDQKQHRINKSYHILCCWYCFPVHGLWHSHSAFFFGRYNPQAHNQPTNILHRRLSTEDDYKIIFCWTIIFCYNHHLLFCN